KSFTSLQDFNLSPEKDLETGEEWLLLDVNVKGNIEKILDQYDYYTNNWIASVPWPIRDKIRLSYNIS
ncbi:hypothetical protein KA005_47715, partial [bacterium]|nr:hypothetical protein [bacterium]